MTWLKLILPLALLGHALIAQAADGLVAIKSPHSAQDAMNRLEAKVKERGLNMFARIDHAAGAMKVGKTLRPTELWNARGFDEARTGTPISAPAAARSACLRRITGRPGAAGGCWRRSSHKA